MCVQKSRVLWWFHMNFPRICLKIQTKRQDFWNNIFIACCIVIRLNIQFINIVDPQTPSHSIDRAIRAWLHNYSKQIVSTCTTSVSSGRLWLEWVCVCGRLSLDCVWCIWFNNYVSAPSKRPPLTSWELQSPVRNCPVRQRRIVVFVFR